MRMLPNAIFLLAILCICLGIYLLYLNKNASINSIAYFCCYGMGIWCYGTAKALYANTYLDALVYLKFTIIGVIGFVSTFLHLCILFTRRETTGRKSILPLLFYLPASVMIYIFAFSLGASARIYKLVQGTGGWQSFFQKQQVALLLDVFVFVYLLSAVLLLLWWREKRKGAEDKRYRNYICLLTLFVIVSFLIIIVLDLRRPLGYYHEYLLLLVIVPVITAFFIVHRHPFLGEDEEILEDKVFMDRSRNKVVQLFSGALVLGGIIYFVTQYFYGNNHRVWELWKMTFFLFFIGALIHLLRKSAIRRESKSIVYAILLSLCIPIITLEFIDSAAISMWVFPVIIMITGILFYDTAVMLLVSTTMVMTQCYLWIRVPKSVVYLDHSDFLGRIILLAGAIFLVSYINRIYRKRLTILSDKIREQDLLFLISALGMDASSENVTEKMEEILQQLCSFFHASCGLVDFIGENNWEDIPKKYSFCNEIVRKSKKESNEEVVTVPLSYQETSMGTLLLSLEKREDEDTLIKNADIAMYRAKGKGKDQYVFCSEEMKTQTQYTMTLTNQIYQALEREEFFLCYQPQIDAKTEEIVALEALIRWKHPVYGLISPATFIPIAEHTGTIQKIGEWVLYEACKRNMEWHSLGGIKPRMAVNVSINQLLTPTFVDIVRRVLKETSLSANYLELEITENIAMQETERVQMVLLELKKLGVSLAIDDFGMEYSSLSRIKSLPLNRLKIDMHFVQRIAHSEADCIMIDIIIMLARNLGVKVIAEGVETKEQFEFLVERDCDEIQGYYFYKPLTQEEINDFLTSISYN
ncbi:MAG: hypothetical protein PWP24_1505 [Clostridiales bacterium]|nr:hypothetical protein [Clostridiales bacterium]